MLVWWWSEVVWWWWTKGPRERVESMLFITTLILLMDSAGLPEGGPLTEDPDAAPEGSTFRLRELVLALGPQFSPTLWTPLWDEEEDEEEEEGANEGWW